MDVVLNEDGLAVVNLLVAFLIPAIVAVVTSQLASGRLKAIVLVVLAAVLAVATKAYDAGGFDVLDAVLLFLQNIAAAVVSHFGVLKPTGITGSEGVLARSTEKIGIGGTVASG